MRKLEMAVLYGGPGGYWDTLIVEVEAPDLAVHHELEELGRKKLYDMEEQGELDDFSGSYLYSDGSWLDEEDVPLTEESDLTAKTRMAMFTRMIHE